MARPTFEQACATYVHRYTMEHVPQWAKRAFNGRYYAPHFRTDREWYEKATFPGEADHLLGRNQCHSRGQSWPLGEWLTEPHRKG